MEADGLILAATRAVHIGCALLLAGLPLFATLIWRAGPAEREHHAVYCRMMLRLLAMALIVEVLTGVVWLGCVAASMADDGPSLTGMGQVLTQTRFGLIWSVRAAIALLLGIWLAAQMAWPALLGRFERLVMGLSLALATALLGSLAWAGHAGAGLRWPAWHLTVDIVHLVAGAVWPIGLVPLLLFLTSARLRGPTWTEADLRVVGRYSGCAFAAVLAVVASGVANAWLTLSSWHDLIASSYGRLLLAKVMVVLVMIALGALNRYRFLPGLAHRGRTGLIRTVAVEAGLTIAVLVIVGFMGMLPPQA